jgi:hypothetical protein
MSKMSELDYEQRMAADQPSQTWNRLREAAFAVCDRWDSPNWAHDAPHTAALIAALREALREHTLGCLTETHQELDAALTERMTFNHWWNAGEVSPGDNPYTHETAAYWAWEGWQAGAKAEREACAQLAEACGDQSIALFIRARGQE